MRPERWPTRALAAAIPPQGVVMEATSTARVSGSSICSYPSDAHRAGRRGSSARLASPRCSSCASRSVPAAARPRPGRSPAVRSAPAGESRFVSARAAVSYEGLPAAGRRLEGTRAPSLGPVFAASWSRSFRGRTWRRCVRPGDQAAASGAGRTRRRPRSPPRASPWSLPVLALPTRTSPAASTGLPSGEAGECARTPSRPRGHPRPSL